MGPAPHIATTSPLLTPVSTQQFHDVANTSERYNPFSSGTLSGNFKRLTSPNGTRTYSACPPANPPVKCEYTNIPAVRPPYIAFASVLLFVLSHWLLNFCLQ